MVVVRQRGAGYSSYNFYVIFTLNSTGAHDMSYTQPQYHMVAERVLFIIMAILIALFSSLIVSRPVISSAHSGFNPATDPVFVDVNVNPKGYGGFTGILDDDHINPDGGLTFKVFYPTGSYQEKRPGVPNGTLDLASPPRYAGGLDPAAGREVCKAASGGVTCSYLWWGIDWGFPGLNRLSLNYVKSDGSTGHATYLDNQDVPHDYIEVKINGYLDSPLVKFENKDNEIITDPAKKTHTISLLVRDPIGMDRIELELDSDTVTLTNGELVPQSATIGDNTYRYTYEWNIEELDAGKRQISATPFSTDGRQTYDIITVTLAVNVNEKLHQQCQEHQTVVNDLINTINQDASSRANSLYELEASITEYVRASKSGFNDTEAAEKIAAAKELLVAELGGLTGQQISCAVSLTDDITAYKESFVGYSDALRAYANALIEYVNLSLEGGSNE
jgi:hypothetical protein